MLPPTVPSKPWKRVFPGCKSFEVVGILASPGEIILLERMPGAGSYCCLTQIRCCWKRLHQLWTGWRAIRHTALLRSICLMGTASHALVREDFLQPCGWHYFASCWYHPEGTARKRHMMWIGCRDH